MAKDLRSFIDDMRQRHPDDVIEIDEVVDPAHYDVTAIIKHLGAMKKFPIITFNKPLNLYGDVSDVRLCMNANLTQRMCQAALGLPVETTRVQIGEECLRREANPFKPVAISEDEAPVKEIVMTGDDVDMLKLPVMRHHEMDGGPYFTMASVVKDKKNEIYNTSFHRMEVKGSDLATLYTEPRHLWRIFKDYESRNEELPVVTVLAHHPAFFMGSLYFGSIDVDEYDMIGGYLQEPLRVTPSKTWGADFMVPADAEIVLEGVLIPGVRMVDGPFGEAPGYMGPQRCNGVLRYEVKAITMRNNAIHESVIGPEGNKPWLDIAREAAYLRRCREAVPGVTAVCKGGRHSHYNIFISMKKLSEGDPGRAAAAALTFDHTKNVFVFDDDIDVFNPTDILWAVATRVQPHKQITIINDILKGNMLDPSLHHEIKTSAMIVDATRPLDRPFSPVSKCPDEAMERIKLEKYIKEEVLQKITVDHTSYWT